MSELIKWLTAKIWNAPIIVEETVAVVKANYKWQRRA